VTEPSLDPTTAAIEAQNAERDQLRADNARLERALVAAYTEIEVIKADRDRLAGCGDASFVAGYDQAVLEIRDHFAKAGDHAVVNVIEATWLKRPA